MRDAPGAVLFALAGSAALAVAFSLLVAGRRPWPAVVCGPFVAVWVILAQELPPTRNEQVGIVTIATIAASISTTVVWYVGWLAGQLRAAGETLRRPR